ncbi:MAG: hypothetical protein BJ554DRAFT_5501, partial [Olpidium bornovanus]
MRLAIDWVHFITHDCDPTDRKTFRWAVISLEFARKVTKGNNILALTNEEFSCLRSKVAVCMTLLISHFDIQGARSRQQLMEERQRYAEQTKNRTCSSFLLSPSHHLFLQPPPCPASATSASTARTDSTQFTGDSTEQVNMAATCSTYGTEGATSYVRDSWVRRISELESWREEKERFHRWIGKVLAGDRPEDRSIMFLASSSSRISLRWQQLKFIGGGSFGSVYLAVNVDTGDYMAVKEIMFHDSSSLSALHKNIKDEMSVMEMLHHPNIVSYYGIEVHRDKVYIFMEYCIAERSRITMADGSTKWIEDVVAGDRIVSWGALPPLWTKKLRGRAKAAKEYDRAQVLRPGDVVSRAWKAGRRPCWKFTLEDGRELIASSEHRVLVNKCDGGEAGMEAATYVEVGHLLARRNDAAGGAGGRAYHRALCSGLTSL